MSSHSVRSPSESLIGGIATSYLLKSLGSLSARRDGAGLNTDSTASQTNQGQVMGSLEQGGKSDWEERLFENILEPQNMFTDLNLDWLCVGPRLDAPIPYSSNHYYNSAFLDLVIMSHAIPSCRRLNP